MPAIHITDIEAAINYWRARQPSPDGIVLSAPLRAQLCRGAAMASDGCRRKTRHVAAHHPTRHGVAL